MLFRQRHNEPARTPPMRHQLINEISEVLSRGSYFDRGDFKTTFEQSVFGDSKLTIEYAHESKFRLTANIPNKKISNNDGSFFRIDLDMSPGEINISESMSVANKDGLLSAISSWLNHLEGELRAAPAARAARKQEQELQNILESYANITDDYLSIEQADALKSRLDAVETSLKENIATSTKDKSEAKDQIDKLTREFSALKAQVDSLKAKGVVAAIFVRFARWASNPVNRKVLKGGFEVARTLLPDSIGGPNENPPK
ncbi:hypothetical protein [Corallococcus exiguus]|uniref:hypothetical protein n=1 Tax=Corallococcus exiguus TaxID=83462 RepID=UPI001471821C|nr:hypothetical protein [Corallococcus exiguus]NNB85405.1 hypothetical protein [Corallococcus exiguus]